MSCQHLTTSDRRLKACRVVHDASSLWSCFEDVMVAKLEILLQIHSITVELRIFYMNIAVLKNLHKKLHASDWFSCAVIQMHENIWIIHLQTHVWLAPESHNYNFFFFLNNVRDRLSKKFLPMEDSLSVMVN